MAQSNKSALGRGLSALLPGAMIPSPPESISEPTTTEAQNTERVPGVSLVLASEIEPNPFQPRRFFDDADLQELAQSIREQGLIQPIVVRKNPAGRGFVLIAGERRLRASKIAGLKVLPVVIRKSTDKESLELAIVENIQRKDLNIVDLALAYQQLVDEFNLTQEELADRMGKDRASVANTLRVLRLSEQTRTDLREGRLSFGHAKALLSLEDGDTREKLRKEIISDSSSVRQAEARAKELAQKKAEEAHTSGDKSLTLDPVKSRLFTLSQEMTRKHSKKVTIHGTDQKGQIFLSFSNRAELDQWIEVLDREKTDSWPKPQT